MPHRKFWILKLLYSQRFLLYSYEIYIATKKKFFELIIKSKFMIWNLYHANNRVKIQSSDYGFYFTKIISIMK